MCNMADGAASDACVVLSKPTLIMLLFSKHALTYLKPCNQCRGRPTAWRLRRAASRTLSGSSADSCCRLWSWSLQRQTRWRWTDSAVQKRVELQSTCHVSLTDKAHAKALRRSFWFPCAHLSGSCLSGSQRVMHSMMKHSPLMQCAHYNNNNNNNSSNDNNNYAFQLMMS